MNYFKIVDDICVTAGVLLSVRSVERAHISSLDTFHMFLSFDLFSLDTLVTH